MKIKTKDKEKPNKQYKVILYAGPRAGKQYTLDEKVETFIAPYTSSDKRAYNCYYKLIDWHDEERVLFYFHEKTEPVK